MTLEFGGEMHTQWHGFAIRAVATTLLLTAASAGDAAELVAQPVILHACYVPFTGTVYRIREPNLKPACASTSHVEFTWTDGAGAIRTGDAAGGDLSGLFPDPTVVKLLGRALSTTPPAAGQVLTFDGSTWVPMTPTHGGAGGGSGDDYPQYLLADGVRKATDGFAVTGALGTGSIPASGSGVRLMWYPGKAAFRAGQAFGADWDDANIGLGSVAMGNGAMASGTGAVAIGGNTSASGQGSTALGASTVASGLQSTALGAGTRADGFASTAMGVGSNAGGSASTAIGDGASAGGIASTAIGGRAFGPGTGVTVAGDYSVAMGSGVTVTGRGNFAFGDATNTAAFQGDNTFRVRASGGTFFYSSPDLTAGVILPANAGAWSTLSNARRKHLFRDESGEDALAKIAVMPIRSWSYKSQDPSIRHLGPTAQDFYAAFRLGESDTTITTTDIDGVALLAIQALERRSRTLVDELAAVRAENDLLREDVRELAALRARLSDLIARVERAEREARAPHDSTL